MQYVKNKLKSFAFCSLLAAGVTGPVLSQSLSTGRAARQKTPTVQEEARRIAEEVADRFIADTHFDFIQVPQKPVLGMEVIDFRHLSFEDHEVAYARGHAAAPAADTVRFGLSSPGRITVWLNKKIVYRQQERNITNPKEIAYSIFSFDTTFSCAVKAGDNEILIKYEAGAAAGSPLVFLRALAADGMADPAVSFHTGGTVFPGWQYLGPLPDDPFHSPEQGAVQAYYTVSGKMCNWQAAPLQLLPELRVDSTAVYQRDPYADWHYSHGTAVWSIMALDAGNPEGKYRRFGEEYCRFTLDNKPYFQWQYDSLYAFRGSYHRIFRRTMLDDTGAPGLPFAALYKSSRDSDLRALADSIVHYIYDRQVRLSDRTFCRPEPVPYTVWADDLFMSVPYLVQMAKATGEKKYFDDAAEQAVRFRKYLWNPETGLYKHGWFAYTGNQSVAHWGRANGWIAWATAELLEELPVSHPRYKEILKMFREHMASLVKYQGASGLWRQLLDKPDSYEETSCTAMFTLAIARGVRNGWLSGKYRRKALLGWEGVCKNIAPGGIVHGICRGTEIGMDEQFYRDRKTIDNDPRGLGAVITAGIEISALK